MDRTKRDRLLTKGQSLIEGGIYDLRDRPRERGQTIAEGQASIEDGLGPALATCDILNLQDTLCRQTCHV